MKRRLIALAFTLFVPVAMAAPPKDAFPKGCVDCHVKEHRITTMLARWDGKADAKKLAAMQAFVPKGVTLKGKHPLINAKEIPGSCLKCHAATSKAIPPLGSLMHGIHLIKGEQGDFTKKFNGDCRHCHKLQPNGVWSLPSGPEK